MIGHLCIELFFVAISAIAFTVLNRSIRRAADRIAELEGEQ